MGLSSALETCLQLCPRARMRGPPLYKPVAIMGAVGPHATTALTNILKFTTYVLAFFRTPPGAYSIWIELSREWLKVMSL